MLEDLLMAAHADARRKVEAMAAEEMQKATGGHAASARHEAAVLTVDVCRSPVLARGPRPRVIAA